MGFPLGFSQAAFRAKLPGLLVEVVPRLWDVIRPIEAISIYIYIL
jgi:hypothetical protein